MAEKRKRLINLHTPTANNIPANKLSLGEIGVEHSSVEGAKLYVETASENASSATVATFITCAATKTMIDNSIGNIIDIISDLTDIVITGGVGDDIITVQVNDAVGSANTLSITHKTETAQSGFNKLSTDGYGHVTGATAVAIADVTGLTGWGDAVKNAETKLSTASTGNGNIVKDISVNDHEITMTKGSITSGDVSDFAEAVVAAQTQLSTATTGTGNAITAITVSDHEITTVLGGPFALSAHTHNGADITGGTVGIDYLPTATTINSSSDDTTVPTSKAVMDAIGEAVTSTMHYLGATSVLPPASTTGDTYIASTDIAIPAEKSGKGVAVTAETGDYIIARDNGTWDVIEKNLDGAVTSTGMTADQIVVANGTNTIVSKAASEILVGSASTATNIDAAPSLQVANTNQITVTVGDKTSDALTVPFATSASTAESASTVPLAGVTDADDLKAIEALSGTSGVLTKTDENTWELVQVISAKTDYETLSTSGQLITADVLKQIIDENELVTAEALNDLNVRTDELSGITDNLDTRVTALENATVDLSTVASAITVNGNTYTVSNGGVDIGNYLSGDTQYISSISQTTTASAVTTTFTVVNAEEGEPDTYDVVEPIIIDCGTY